jgi:hypothetical protein
LCPREWSHSKELPHVTPPALPRSLNTPGGAGRRLLCRRGAIGHGLGSWWGGHHRSQKNKNRRRGPCLAKASSTIACLPAGCCCHSQQAERIPDRYKSSPMMGTRSSTACAEPSASCSYLQIALGGEGLMSLKPHPVPSSALLYFISYQWAGRH